ncbi:MAG TPA: DNA starvation/stationary phase protection protein Dps [Gemmatimonadales bacterium]|nr:DNA starvation/stationary phase protection protein Dps [Gemmatimonadales bacterium]
MTATMTRSAKKTSIAYETGNDLPEKVRGQIIDLLNQRLADAIDLASQAKQAHWNVKGPAFIALHKLFDEVHEAVQEYVDLIAERVVQLGGLAEGTVRVAADLSELSEYPKTPGDGERHVNAMAGVLAEFGSRIRTASDEAGELGDQDTADICTEVSRGIDKWLWFVEAHVQRRVGR